MKKRTVLRRSVFCALLVVMLLTLAGCGPRIGTQQLPVSAGEQNTREQTSVAGDLIVDLPALYLDLAADGAIQVGGASLAQFGVLLGQDLSVLTVDPAWVQFLVAGNIQHIQVANTQEGLLILANGEPVPSLGWDGDALVATAETLTLLGAQISPLVGKLIPIVQNLGVGVVIRVPLAPGATVIPLQVQGDASAAALAAQAQADFLAAVGRPPQIRATIRYAEDGSFQLAGLTGAELTTLGIPLEAIFAMPGNTVRQISDRGIRTFTLASNPQGIFISINGKTLPHITWGEGQVNHLLELAAQMGLLERAGLGPATDELVQTIETFLPIVQAADLNLTITFPE